MRFGTNARRFLVSALTLLLGAQVLVARESAPIVTRAWADRARGILTLEGRRFGSSPKVFMGLAGGEIRRLVVVSPPNDRWIEAELANIRYLFGKLEIGW